MPRGHSFSIYASFLGKKNFTVFSWEKGDHYYTQTRRNDLFFSLQSFCGKTQRKLAQLVHMNTEQVYRIALMPPGHAIILLNSN